MKQTKTKVDKKEAEKIQAMHNADLILNCVSYGVLEKHTAAELMVPIFETLGIKK